MAEINDDMQETVSVLIVEDSATQAEQLRHLLEKNSYMVTMSQNGNEALKILEKFVPTLIISDIVMPGMNGFELCSKIKSNDTTKDIPVILLTSLASTEDVLEGLACGADNFISKPYNEQYLLSNIANILVNINLKKNERVRVGVEIRFGGKNRFITADQQQMLSMLISTYEAAVNRNKELLQAQEELETINERLEELVEERTAELSTEIDERKKADERDRLAREVLDILNNYQKREVIRDILLIIREKTGIEAVGVRLRQGDDFPYFESFGFSDEFLRDEMFLCARDTDGNIIYDSRGDPVLECMCGNILSGKVDSNKLFYTPGGSFWSNSTTELLESLKDKDDLKNTRNRCNAAGFESVALVPLRSDEEIIGLLQLNDHRPGLFVPEMIDFFESLGASIGIALMRTQAEEKLQSKVRELQRWYDAMLEREDRVLDLKREVNDVLRENGKPARYSGL